MSGMLQSGSGTQHVWEIIAGLGIAALAVAGVAVYLLRKFFQSSKEEQQEKIAAGAPRTENASAFMAASMQGVIQQLREQEKELERLHKIEKERAEQTERLSEEVTRNMPAGLVVVNATGIISTANPGQVTRSGNSRTRKSVIVRTMIRPVKNSHFTVACVIPYSRYAATNNNPVDSSTSGYITEIGSPQVRHFPLSQIHANIGTLS